MLLLSNGRTQRISRENLLSVETPVGTRSHRPVPHYDVATLVNELANANGYEVVSEEYGLSRDQSKLFGVLRFHPEGHPEFTRCVGFRNSHDKTLSVSLVVGVSVLVCDNLCFGGGQIVSRKHTANIDLEELIPGAFTALAPKYEDLELNINRLKESKLTLNKARILTTKAAENKIIPSCDIIPVFREFVEPSHPEFLPRNEWSLYNAFTEIAKKFPTMKADKCYRGLGQMFDLAG